MKGMREIIYSLPQQLIEGINLFNYTWSDTLNKKNFRKRFERVLICGMGGSGISGDITSILYPELDIRVNKDYQIPHFIDNSTLGILISYSGNTEETLYNYKILRKMDIPLVIISSNGQLLKKEALFKIQIPGGFPPRGALGYLFTPIPLLLHRCGLIKKNPETELANVAQFLREELKTLEKKGKRLAQLLGEKIPIIYANSNPFGVVAKRWQCQLNENSKILCHINIIPEMNHNEIVGLGSPKRLNKDLVIIFLNDPGAFIRNRLRVKIIKEVIDREISGLTYIDINPPGKSLIKQVFWTMMLGDFLSFYLAMAKGIDPLPVARIDFLKSRLS